jgi:uncharacterized protein (TIGR03435 family)
MLANGGSMLNGILRNSLVFVIASACCVAQNDQSPHFEVASVRPVTTDVRMGFQQDPGRMSWARIPLTNLISDAYHVGLDQITGPDWLNSEFYAIDVKLPSGFTKEQYPQMMANLLSERFGLVVHRVTKEVSGYEIILAPGGPKLTPSVPAMDTDAPAADGPRREMPMADANGFPVLPPGGPLPFASRIDGGMERMAFKRSSMAILASRLQSVFSRSGVGQTIPIADRTGIGGRFDFNLAIPASSYRLPARLQTGQGAPGGASDTDVSPASISAAMEKQLGLKLKARRTSLDFIVVDRVERVPSAN